MACIGCEEFAKRITNAFRDEEIKEKFENLTGYELINDCFICDNCNDQLQHASEFQNKCKQIYQKNHPNTSKTPNPLDELTKANEIFIIDSHQDVTLHHDDPKIDDCGEFEVFEIAQSTDDPKSDDYILQEMEMDEESEDAEVKMPFKMCGKTRPRRSYTVEQKLKMIEYAEKHTNRHAAKHFSINESSIRCFRKQKEQLARMKPTKKTNRHGNPHWPELEVKLKSWVDKQANKPKINDIQGEAIRMAKNLKLTNFNGSTSYIFKFMQRHGITASSPRPRKVKVEKDGDNDDMEDEID